MSPLARSLLALAAILAVTNATAIKQSKKVKAVSNLSIPPNCVEKDIGPLGDRDVHLSPVNVACPRGKLDVHSQCELQGMRFCGEHILACNTDPYGPPPTIDVPYGLTPVYILCNDPYENEATVTITAHCCFNKAS